MIPKVIDLFSGCGGLALGFEKAGFDVVAGIDLMPEAIKTISYNLDWRYGRSQTHICDDITNVDSDVFDERVGNEGCIIIGGPPCQAYSMAGKGKLRSLGEERINTKDSRGTLYKEYLRFVYHLKPRAVVMENVPESTNYGSMNIPQHVCDLLESKGYRAIWTILNAADFGVPQVRERVFVLAVKKNEKIRIPIPVPTNSSYGTVTTMYQRRFDTFSKYRNFAVPLQAENVPRWVTVGEAFSDLPILFSSPNANYKLNKVNMELPYKSEPKSSFQTIMRNWYKCESSMITGNSFRKNVRDFPIFSKMKEGDNYLAASKIADEMFNEAIKIHSLTKDTEEYNKMKRKIIPCYDRKQFENKWKKLDSTKPSHTVVAHLAKDTYSHIHPWEPRGISVREAARLQSFPDDFFFDCSMSDAYKQIGNAVPPLLSYGIAKAFMEAFGEDTNEFIRGN